MALESDDDDRSEDEGLDEMSVSLESVNLLIKYEGWILDSYSVMIELSEKDEKKQHQWIQLSGDKEYRILAKDYIKALCNPEKQIVIHYPFEVMNYLTNQQTHSKLEHQSSACIIFEEAGEATIQGSSLSVTLAMSAIEDLISSSVTTDQSIESPKTDKSSTIMGKELIRIMSHDDSLTCDEETVNSMPSEVKRTMLKCYNDLLSDPIEIDSDSESPQRAKAARKVTSKSNICEDSVTELEKQMESAALDVSNQSSDVTMEKNLRKFAQKKGYTVKEIDEVIKMHGTNVSFAQFIGHLFTYRRSLNLSDDSFGEGETAVIVTGSKGKQTVDVQLVDDLSPPHHPLEGLLSTNKGARSPLVKQRKVNPSVNPTVSSTQRDEFMELLADHFEEDDSNLSLAVLKEKSIQRQKVLNRIFQGSSQPTKPEVPIEDDICETGLGDNSAAFVESQISLLKSFEKNKRLQDSSSSDVEIVEITEAPSSKQPETTVTKFNKRKHESDGSDIEVVVSNNTIMAAPQPSTSNVNQSSLHKSGIHSSGKHHMTGSSPLDNIYPEPAPKHFDRNYSQNRGSGARPKNKRRMHSSSPSKKYPAEEGGSVNVPPEMPQMIDLPPSSAVSAHSSSFNPSQGSASLTKDSKRYVVLDGSNIAMAHGNQKIFSCMGIKICVEYFRKRGHKHVMAFVPQWRTRHPSNFDKPISDQHILEELSGQGFLTYTPSRRLPGKNIVCYDDKFVLRLADETNGVVISNDNYRDLYQEKAEWRNIIENRLIMFSFVGDIFMVPDDPLGRNGPTLDQLLSNEDLSHFNVQNQIPVGMIQPRNRSQFQQQRHPYQQQHQRQNFQYKHQQQQNRRQQTMHQKPQPQQQQNNTPKKRTNQNKLEYRSKAITNELRVQLLTLNVDESIIQEVLNENPYEKDVEVLANVVMEKSV